jgi:hypothetical protein
MVFEAPVNEAAVKTTRLFCDGVNEGAGVAVVATVVGTAVVAVTTGVGAGVAGTVVGVAVVGVVGVLCVQPAKSADTNRRQQIIPMSASFVGVNVSFINHNPEN